MEKLEPDSRIRAYLKAHTRGLAPTLETEQEAQSRLHAQSYSQLEIFANEWRKAGVRGMPGSRDPESKTRESLVKLDSPSMEEFLDHVSNDQHRSDRGAILLGNTMLSILGMERDGIFSLYDFTARYNNDAYGTAIPTLPFVHVDHPAVILSEDERSAIDRSFQNDPTGAGVLANPSLWPSEFRGMMLSSQLDGIREEMVNQIPHYQRFSKNVLYENPQALERYQNHPERALSSGVSADILSALGDF